VPLTAQHVDAGVLDATADPLGEGVPWEAIHRARPRAPLTCRECGHGLHAKLSPKGLRFFAHDRAAPDCSLVGETMAHRLLKLQLASAIREAGWYAELEVAGEGWRADVLATSPDGTKRMAWEAQLAQITVDELRARTGRMRASGVPVCWVTDRDRPWVGAVPAIQLSMPTEPGPIASPADAQVVNGTAVFREPWCPGRLCENDGGAPGPCPGHGWWAPVLEAVNLSVFVAGVLAGTIRPHQVVERRYLLMPTAARIVWTTRRHAITERDQAEASERRRERDELAAAERERHLAAIAAKLARQQALTPPTVELIGREARGYVGVRDASPEWAMGVPLFVHDMPQGVISPVVSRVSAEVLARLRGLTLFVATEAERRALARACGPGQRIVRFEVEIPDKPRPPAVTYRRAGRVR
jgi:competence protein CoiA